MDARSERRDENSVTQLLEAVKTGEPEAKARLVELIYDQLRRNARALLKRERPGGTSQPTDIVHDALLKLGLIRDGPVQYEDRPHLFGAAAKAMRRVIVDHARNKGSLKRGGGQRPGALDESNEPAVRDEDTDMKLAIDEALTKLAKLDARQGQIVELRYYVGLSVDETARALGISPRTVDDEWKYARAWLMRELSKGDTRISEELELP